MASVSNAYNSEEEDIDDDEEIDETGYKTVKDAVLFAIEISPSMLTKPPSSSSDSKGSTGDSPALAALKCAYQLMQQRIISNPRDMIGILLFGTAKSKFEGESDDQDSDKKHEGGSGLLYPHCYLLTDLDVPAAIDVRKVRSLVEDEETARDLLVPSKEPVSMANMLFCTNQIFTTKAPNFSSRRLFLITDEDDPHGKNKALRQAATVRAKDLYDLGVIIELFPIAKPGKGFERSLFYDDIIYRPSLSDPEAPVPTISTTKTASVEDGISLLQSLLSCINSKNSPRQALFSLPFEIAPDFKISVKGYILIKRQEPVRSCYVWLNGDKPQIAVGTSKQISEVSEAPINKAEIRKAYKFGGETVSFTKEETERIRDFGSAIIRIIGFKSLSKLPIWASIRAPIFMYPSEESYIGSIRVFSALHQKLLNSQKFALAWFIARKNASPVLAAIYASAERLSDDGDQIVSPGLWIQPLPFVDDIRQNPESNLVRAPDDLVDIMRMVIQQLQLPKARYEPLRYPNPALQWFYRILQALALEEDLPEKPDDKTVPRYRQIKKRAGQYILEWGESLTQHITTWQRNNKSGPAKREAENFHGSMPKRVKTEGEPGKTVLNDAKIRSAFEGGSLNQFSVPVLKAWAVSKNLQPASKKADLVEIIEQYIEKM